MKKKVSSEKLKKIPEALPLLDAWHPSRLSEEIVTTVLKRIKEERKALKELAYPYDGAKLCTWNLAMTLRIQVQIRNAYSDRLSRLVAAAESQLRSFFSDEVLQGEILPRVRTLLNDSKFLQKVTR